MAALSISSPRKGKQIQPLHRPRETKHSELFAPKGPKQISPGQRPGKRNPSTRHRPERAKHIRRIRTKQSKQDQSIAATIRTLQTPLRHPVSRARRPSDWLIRAWLRLWVVRVARDARLPAGRCSRDGPRPTVLALQ